MLVSPVVPVARARGPPHPVGVRLLYGQSKKAEQPTPGQLRRARLGRITLWKSYALIRQEKTMIRGAAGFKNMARANSEFFRY